MLPSEAMSPLFLAAAEATEEAILNAMCMAATMTGWQGRTAHALPLDRLQAVMVRARAALR
jgi:D-aminopeptidase